MLRRFSRARAQVARAAPARGCACRAAGASILQGTFLGKAAFLCRKGTLAGLLLQNQRYPFEAENHSGAFAAKAVVLIAVRSLNLATQHRVPSQQREAGALIIFKEFS